MRLPRRIVSGCDGPNPEMPAEGGTYKEIKMRTLTSVLALAAFVALQATGAEEVPVQEKEVITTNETRQTTSTSVERSAPQATNVAVEIQNDLRGDPLFEQ